MERGRHVWRKGVRKSRLKEIKERKRQRTLERWKRKEERLGGCEETEKIML